MASAVWSHVIGTHRLPSQASMTILPDDWAERLREHLVGCDGCTAYIAQMRTVLDTLEQLDGTPT